MGQKNLASPYYSQLAVFVSLRVLFHYTVFCIVRTPSAFSYLVSDFLLFAGFEKNSFL